MLMTRTVRVYSSSPKSGGVKVRFVRWIGVRDQVLSQLFLPAESCAPSGTFSMMIEMLDIKSMPSRRLRTSSRTGPRFAAGSAAEEAPAPSMAAPDGRGWFPGALGAGPFTPRVPVFSPNWSANPVLSPWARATLSWITRRHLRVGAACHTAVSNHGDSHGYW